MAIDPMLYQKLSGKKGDPYTRLGQALAKDAKAKQERDAMPKGVSGGLKVMRKPGLLAQLYYAIKDRLRSK